MKIGYQLFSAYPRCKDQKGLADTIRKIAAMGYDGVEFFDYQGLSAVSVKDLLAECGIVPINAHVSLERFQKNIQGEIDYAKTVGIPYLTIPWLKPELRNREGYQQLRNQIQQWQVLCKEQGIVLLYHNHEFEFQKIFDDRYVLDDLLTDTEVKLELDTFWASYAKVDPVHYMKKHQKQLELIHVKDYESLTGGGIADGVEMPAFCAVGSGGMDVSAIIEAAKDLAVSWIVVEQDNSEIDVLESAYHSMQYLRKCI